MKLRTPPTPTLCLTLLTTLALHAGLASSRAGEVSFKHVVTERVARPHGPYFGFYGGAAPTPDITTEGQLRGFTTDTETAWMLGAEFGYEFNTPSRFRPAFEAELFYTGYEFNAFRGADRAVADPYHVNLMFNMILALDLADYGEVGTFRSAFHPFVGAGLGGALSGARDSNLMIGADSSEFADGTSFSFSYQFFAGLEYELSDYVSLYGEYRWLYVEDLPGGALSQADMGLWNAGVKVRY